MIQDICLHIGTLAAWAYILGIVLFR